MIFNYLFLGLKIASGIIFLGSKYLYTYFYHLIVVLFFFIYYFLFQLIFLKRYFWLSVLSSFSTYLAIAYYMKGLNFEDFLETLSENIPGKVICLIELLSLLILYYLTAFITKRLGWRRKLTKRTDVYPISLFIPKEKTVQKALVKREQGKAYYELLSFISYVIAGVALCYVTSLMGTFRFISLYEEYGKSSFFIPWAVMYLPLLYLVYKGYWVAAVGIYVCWLVELSIKGFLYNLEDYQNLLFFVRGFIFIRAGMLLAVICKVEREKRRKNHIGFESSED